MLTMHYDLRRQRLSRTYHAINELKAQFDSIIDKSRMYYTSISNTMLL